MRRAAVSVIVAIAGAAAAAATAELASGLYGTPQRAGLITSPRLPEVSGLTAASTADGWWVLNDSGNAPNLYSIGPRGGLKATLRVPGTVNVDWEDLAAARLADGRRYLYIGDIGDNASQRAVVVVYRIPEPRPNARETARATAFPFTYPEGPHNAEALFVDPGSGRIYVITKSVSPAEAQLLYRFPLPLRAGRTVKLERVQGPITAHLEALTAITGAALSADGRRLVVRTYIDALEWRRKNGSPFESLFRDRPDHLALALEAQGESIAYTSDGASLVTTSEQLPAPLWTIPLG